MIEVITGLPGFGKTLTATRWALKAIAKGKKVYANFPLKGAEYYDDVYQLLGNVKNALVIVDEGGIVFDQLRVYKVPDYVWMELRQHRHDGVDMLMTAQSIYDIAHPMRRLIQFEWNIYFKMWRYRSVICRNPQPRGDSYGRRFWYISPKLFDMYDTHHKVNAHENPNAIKGENDIVEDKEINIVDHYSVLQDEMLMNALLKSKN